jgi:acetyltransferase-like isoleucine patch superfamily enzyme
MKVWSHLRYELLKCWWQIKPGVRKVFDDILPGRPKIERLGRVSYRAKIEGHHKNILIRAGACVREGAWLSCQDAGSSIEIGERTLIMPWSKLVAGENGSIKIGRDCTVHSFDVLYGYAGGLQIGNNVRIGVNVSVISGNHGFDDPSSSPNEQGGTSEGIIIRDNVWIGAGVIILDGVEIGAGAVLGAGAVITKSMPPNSVCLGVPARAVRRRGEPLSSTKT